MPRSWLLALFVSVLLCGSLVNGKVTRDQARVPGDAVGNGSWETNSYDDPGTFVFLDKFAYDKGSDGLLEFQITTRENTDNLNLLFFDDDKTEWYAVYNQVDANYVGNCHQIQGMAGHLVRA